jgi:hypothetical protein
MIPNCPACGSPETRVGYTLPPTYWCVACGVRLRDKNNCTIPVLSEAQARRKRPRLYGLPECGECCTHEKHEGPCVECAEENRKRHLPVVLEVVPATAN